MSAKTPKLKPLDLTKLHPTFGSTSHPDIEIGKSYLIKVNGLYYVGKFYPAWYGLHFENKFQYVQPGTNASQWEAVWEIVEE